MRVLALKECVVVVVVVVDAEGVEGDLALTLEMREVPFLLDLFSPLSPQHAPCTKRQESHRMDKNRWKRE